MSRRRCCCKAGDLVVDVGNCCGSEPRAGVGVTVSYDDEVVGSATTDAEGIARVRKSKGTGGYAIIIEPSGPCDGDEFTATVAPDDLAEDSFVVSFPPLVEDATCCGETPIPRQLYLTDDFDTIPIDGVIPVGTTYGHHDASVTDSVDGATGMIYFPGEDPCEPLKPPYFIRCRNHYTTGSLSWYTPGGGTVGVYYSLRCDGEYLELTARWRYRGLEVVSITEGAPTCEECYTEFGDYRWNILDPDVDPFEVPSRCANADIIATGSHSPGGPTGCAATYSVDQYADYYASWSEIPPDPAYDDLYGAYDVLTATARVRLSDVLVDGVLTATFTLAPADGETWDLGPVSYDPAVGPPSDMYPPPPGGATVVVSS